MLSSSSSSSYSSSSSSSSSSFHCLFFSLSLSPPRSTYIVPQHHTCPRFSSPSYPTPSCPAAIRHPRSISFASHSCLELSSARSALGFTTLFRTITLLKGKLWIQFLVLPSSDANEAALYISRTLRPDGVFTLASTGSSGQRDPDGSSLCDPPIPHFQAEEAQKSTGGPSQRH